jgi:hypothetical protein
LPGLTIRFLKYAETVTCELDDKNEEVRPPKYTKIVACNAVKSNTVKSDTIKSDIKIL